MTSPSFGAPGKGAKLPFGRPGQSLRTYDEGDYAETRAEVPRDQWDRYLIPSADGTKPAVNKGRLRVSTMKKVGSDASLLQDKAERLIVKGLAMSPELAAAAMRASALEDDSKEQRKELRRIAAQAFELAGGNERRDLGNKMHELTHALNKNRFDDGPEPIVPPELAPHIDAYYAALEQENLQVIPELMERVVLCPYDVGGAFDNIMRRWNAETEMFELVIVDLKTGKTLEFSHLEFLIQLWMYANAYFMFVTEAIETDDSGKIVGVRGHVEELPLELRRDRAIVVHVPLDGSATVYELDLSGVDRYAAASIELKRANSEAKHKYRELSTVRPAAFQAPSAELEAGRGRIPTYSDLSGGATDYPAGPVVDHFNGHPGMVTPDGGQTWTPPLPPVERDPATGLNNFQPTPTAPTPDAAEQAHKAEVRREMAAKLAAPAAPPVPEIDPVTGKKKRSCGYCKKPAPGHTAKTCPDNPDSPKYDPQARRTAAPDRVDETLARLDAAAIADGRNDDPDDGVPAGQPEPQNNCDCHQDGDWHPYVAGQCRYGFTLEARARQGKDPLTGDPIANVVSAGASGPVTLTDQDAAPFCLKLDHSVCTWTASPPVPKGSWGCSITGKPSRQYWEAHQVAPRVTAVAPSFGHPDGEAVAHLAPQTATSDASVTPPPVKLDEPVGPYAPSRDPYAPPPGYAAPPADLTQAGIDAAQLPQQLLDHRLAEIAAGRWNESYEPASQAKWQQLVAQHGYPAPPPLPR